MRAVCFVHTDQTVENYMSTFSFPLFDSFCAQTVCMFHARAEERVLTMLFFSAGAHYLSVMTLMSDVSRVCLPQKFKVGIDFLTTLRPGLRFIFFFYILPGGKACTWAEVAKRQFRGFLV